MGGGGLNREGELNNFLPLKRGRKIIREGGYLRGGGIKRGFMVLSIFTLACTA